MRACWCYGAVDNGQQPSATRVVPELQRIAIGAVFPALPGVTDGFTVLAFEAPRWLTLGWPRRRPDVATDVATPAERSL